MRRATNARRVRASKKNLNQGGITVCALSTRMHDFCRAATRGRRMVQIVLASIALMAVAASPAAASSSWFDATNGQLSQAGWPVSNTNATGWAQAGRAAQGFCGVRGFVGGFLNGHQRDDRKGVICVRAVDAQWFDATDGQLLDTGWPVWDTNAALWAQAKRAAQGFCGVRGFVGGFLNGHQSGNRKGVICIRASAARWFH